jgi:hypothetical protein
LELHCIFKVDFAWFLWYCKVLVALSVLGGQYLFTNNHTFSSIFMYKKLKFYLYRVWYKRSTLYGFIKILFYITYNINNDIVLNTQDSPHLVKTGQLTSGRNERKSDCFYLYRVWYSIFSFKLVDCTFLMIVVHHICFVKDRGACDSGERNVNIRWTNTDLLRLTGRLKLCNIIETRQNICLLCPVWWARILIVHIHACANFI